MEDFWTISAHLCAHIDRRGAKCTEGPSSAESKFDAPEPSEQEGPLVPMTISDKNSGFQLSISEETVFDTAVSCHHVRITGGHVTPYLCGAFSAFGGSASGLQP